MKQLFRCSDAPELPRKLLLQVSLKIGAGHHTEIDSFCGVSVLHLLVALKKIASASVSDFSSCSTFCVISFTSFSTPLFNVTPLRPLQTSRARFDAALPFRVDSQSTSLIMHHCGIE